MSPSAQEKALVEPGRLLVVDDQAAIRRAHARVLGVDGHEIVLASGVAEALALLEPGRFDAVLSDVQMPEGNGIELLQAVRNRDPEVSVVLISGHPDLPTALKAVEYGALEYLAKPVELPKLRASMSHAVEVARQRRNTKLEAQRLRSGERLRIKAPEEPASRTGELLGGRYRLGGKIGEGGMGAVYQAAREDLGGMPVAVKIVHPDLGFEPELLQRFRREAEIIASIDHPNVVRIFDFQAPEGSPAFLVMELLHGMSLARALAAQGQLAQLRAVSIAQQILSGLSVAHGKHIVHRDLKPENVFLMSVAGLGDVVRLLDFGIAKAIDGEDQLRLTRTGAVLGTPAYMAPEQARGQAFDRRGDIWAVGCILYEMLAGRPPFRAENYNALLRQILEARPDPLRELRPELPEDLCVTVERAMSRSLDDRYQTVEEMSEELLRWSPVAISSVPPSQRALERAATVRLPSSRPARPASSRLRPG